MKVLVISQYYPPEGAVIPPAIAQWMASQGHTVRVLTGYPNYPGGVVFEGYRQQWRGRDRDGAVWVTRIPLCADHSQFALRRIVSTAVDLPNERESIDVRCEESRG